MDLIMNSLPSIYSSSTIIFSDIFQQGKDFASRNLLQNHERIALSIFCVASIAFFAIADFFAQIIEDIFYRRQKSQPSFSAHLIRGVAVGGTVHCLNLLLSKMTDYSPNKSVMAAIAASSTILSLFKKGLPPSPNNKISHVEVDILLEDEPKDSQGDTATEAIIETAHEPSMQAKVEINQTHEPNDVELHKALLDVEKEFETPDRVNDSLFLNYLANLRNYLCSIHDQLKLKNLPHKKMQEEVTAHLQKLKQILTEQAGHPFFIYECLACLENFVTHVIFQSSENFLFSEPFKNRLMTWQELFSIFDQHYPTLEKHHPQNAQRIKIKLANLPLGKSLNRSDFKNIFLSEQEQRAILIRHCQKLEDQVIARIAQLIKDKEKKKLFTEAGLLKVLKWVRTDCHRLSEENKKRLTEALLDASGQKMLTHSTLQEHLKHLVFVKNMIEAEFYEWNASSLTEFPDPYKFMRFAYFASKAKHFFLNNKHVPRWHHATKPTHVQTMLSSASIKFYLNGAWVSSMRERDYGEHVFVFQQAISELNVVCSNVNMGMKGRRWRGVQQNIPFLKEKKEGELATPYLLTMGIPRTTDKSQKIKFTQDLEKAGLVNPKIYYYEFIDYLQQIIFKTIGSPNLPENWWEKESPYADILDHFRLQDLADG